MVANLDPQQGREIKRSRARQLTTQAVTERNALLLSAAAELWDEIGEVHTARNCRKMSNLWMLIISDGLNALITPK